MTNTFIVRASDAAANTATGQVTIITSSTTGAYSGAITVSGSTLSGATSYSGVSFSSVTQIVLKSPVAFASGSGSGIIPNGTVVTNSSGGTFDPGALNALVVTASGLASNQTANGALEFGISNVGLNFSKPVKIQIPVPGYTSSTIAVKVKHGGTNTYVTTGLTNLSTATCSNGVASSPSAVATVALGIATIYTCAGSTFVAYTEAAPTTTGGSTGGGSAGYSILPTTLTGSPLPAPTLLGSGTLISNEVARFTIDTKTFKKSKLLKAASTLKNGTRVYVYRVSPRGKEIKVGQARVMKSQIQYRIKVKGNYIFCLK